MKVKQSVLYTHKNIIQDSYFKGCEECVRIGFFGADYSNVNLRFINQTLS